ncbi:hypothetical protein R6Q57_009565 [Mikania cordata]
MNDMMGCRRRHGITRSSTFKELDPPNRHHIPTSSSSAPSSPLATRNNHRDSPLSSAHVFSSFQHTSLQSQNKKTEDKFYMQNPWVDGKIQSAKPQTVYDQQQLETYRDGSHDKRTQDIQETFKLQNKKTEVKHDDFFTQNLWPDGKMQPAKPQTVHEHQLMASRDVAIATAAKAKLLLREIKTVKADLAFAKERSSQLEEQNKILREAREKGDHPTDDDMIRLQLETLLAEKARLANENSVYVRENSCLREIIRYHNLSMQDIVYLDEGIEEVAEVNPRLSRTLSVSPLSPLSPETIDQLALKDSKNHGDDTESDH